jgi:hypothetical protein
MNDGRAITRAEYFATLSPDRREAITALDALIRKTVPKLKPCVLNTGIGYGPYHYRYESGREGDAWVIGLSSRKQYISLYVLCVVEKKFLAENYKKHFPRADIGRCCIRFKKTEDLPVVPLRKLLKEAAKIGGMSAV